MKYMLMIHQGTTPTPLDPGRVGDAVRRRAAGDLRGVQVDQRDARGHARATACSHPRRRPPCGWQDGKTITTDGPFVDTKESLNGYLIYEADDLDAAIALAAQIPAARLGGAIEVRPIMEW